MIVVKIYFVPVSSQNLPLLPLGHSHLKSGAVSKESSEVRDLGEQIPPAKQGDDRHGSAHLAKSASSMAESQLAPVKSGGQRQENLAPASETQVPWFLQGMEAQPDEPHSTRPNFRMIVGSDKDWILTSRKPILSLRMQPWKL